MGTHPQLAPDLARGVIQYDVGVVVLMASALERCGQVVPIAWARDATAVATERLFIGGYGFRDEAETQDGVRSWAEVDVTGATTLSLLARDIGLGFPARGDSGGPLLAVGDDGTPELVAVLSTVVPPMLAATQVSSAREFIGGRWWRVPRWRR